MDVVAAARRVPRHRYVNEGVEIPLACCPPRTAREEQCRGVAGLGAVLGVGDGLGVVVYVVGSTTLVLFVASLAVLDAERDHPGANIMTFRDTVWWAFTTVTTVGYGDRFPVTDTGRLVAVGLMLAGIALLGVVTATFASWLLEKVAAVEEASQAATRRDVEELTREVVALREALRHGSGD